MGEDSRSREGAAGQPRALRTPIGVVPPPRTRQQTRPASVAECRSASFLRRGHLNFPPKGLLSTKRRRVEAKATACAQMQMQRAEPRCTRRSAPLPMVSGDSAADAGGAFPAPCRERDAQRWLLASRPPPRPKVTVLAGRRAGGAHGHGLRRQPRALPGG